MSDNATYPGALPSPPDELQTLLASYRGSIFQIAPRDERALHTALCAYVQQLKAAQLPPERVLVTVKAIALRSGVPPSIGDGFPVKGRLACLMDTIVQWSITEYYRAGDACVPVSSTV
jgi:hypothetical protein